MECEFRYQPEGGRRIPVCALRTEKEREDVAPEDSEQYQLFETSCYKYRIFVTDLDAPIYFVVWFYNQRAGAENLIKDDESASQNCIARAGQRAGDAASPAPSGSAGSSKRPTGSMQRYLLRT